MWSAVELREIRVFLTLAEELHFGRTAERLLVTPARVSQTISALESRVGGRLFDRTSRRVNLTPLGEQMRDTMAPAYERMRSAWAAAQESAAGMTGVLRVSMYSMGDGGPHLVTIIRTFGARHPGCRVEVTDTGITDQLALLRRGDADIVAVRLPLGASDVVLGPHLSCEERVLAVAVGHPLADRESIAYDELADYTVTDNSTFPRELANDFIPPRTSSGTRLRRVDIRTFSEALLRVATGEIVHPTVGSILDHHGRPGITTVPIHDLPPSRTALVWLAGREDLRIRAFADAARDVVGDTDQQHDRTRRAERSEGGGRPAGRLRAGEEVG